jgi:ABC-type multidrug transport system ATPase subunit
MYCDRVAILYNHKIIAAGSPESVKSMYFKTDEITLQTAPGNYEAIMSELRSSFSSDIQRALRRDNCLAIYTNKSEAVVYDLLRAIDKNNEKLISLDVRKPSLAEIFESFKRD